MDLRSTWLPILDERREHLSSEMLAGIAADLASGLAGDEMSVPPHQKRGFVRLTATPSYEVWLIAWEPSSSLEMHDHGGSHGAIHVARGTLAESYLDPGQRGRVRRRRLHAGANVVVPARRIHEVWNPGPETTLSIHAYSPPLTGMTFYKDGRDGFGRSTEPRKVPRNIETRALEPRP